MKSITVVVPVFNEEHVIEKFYTALKAELTQLAHYSYTILFVVDGGRDKTASISRDIGHQMALLAGLDHAAGDAVITMDGDLQHPPHLISQLLREFEQGNDVVHAVRKDTEDIGLRRKFASIIFYRFMNVISDTPIIEGAADFRLLSRRVVEIIRTKIRERNLFIRGIVNWVGFPQSTVSFVAAKRAAGVSKYSLLKLIRFAFSGSVSFSRKPLRVASFVWLLCALGGFLFTALTVVEYWLGDPFPSGWATVVILLSVFGGLQLVFLGIVGEYVGAIFDEVKARPHYLINEVINE